MSTCITVNSEAETLEHRRNFFASSGVRLTYWLGLPVEVVEQLCVAGEHAAACRTGDESLLSVASHVFSQTVPDLEKGVAACE